MPFTALTVVVPESGPPPGLVPIATVMLSAEARQVLPSAFCTVTWTGGVSALPAGVLVGWLVNASFVGEPPVQLDRRMPRSWTSTIPFLLMSAGGLSVAIHAPRRIL